MPRLRYDPGLYCVVPTKYSKSLRDAPYVLVRTHFADLLFPGRQIIQGKMAEQSNARTDLRRLFHQLVC